MKEITDGYTRVIQQIEAKHTLDCGTYLVHIMYKYSHETTFRNEYEIFDYSLDNVLWFKERKKLMGELIIILSITLILTVLSSFWIGYSYGKLRTIKLYEETQIQTFKDYMNSTYGTTGKDISNETDTD